jgi:hypothetical protein
MGLGLRKVLAAVPELSGPTGARSTRIGSAFGFFGRHPVLLLLLLSPGIPEYLSPSSPLYVVLMDPGRFFLLLLLNLGLYGSGVLLIREARVRWKKGWGSVLLMGAAYGILEEGIALSTLFNPKAGPVGVLGYYGHWLGVSWVWLVGLLVFHALFSISLPILLLDLALPEKRGVPFFGWKKTLVVLAVLCLDVSALFSSTLAGGFWMGTPVLIGSLAAIAVLVLAARRAPAGLFNSIASPLRRSSLRLTLVIGGCVFPVTFFLPYVTQGAGLPLEVTIIILMAIAGGLLLWAVRNLSFPGNERQLVVFALGLVVPIAAVGVVAELPLELVLLADLALGLFFRRLLRMYPPVLGTHDPSSS